MIHCRHCHRELPKENLKYGLFCPYCGFVSKLTNELNNIGCGKKKGGKKK